MFSTLCDVYAELIAYCCRTSLCLSRWLLQDQNKIASSVLRFQASNTLHACLLALLAAHLSSELTAMANKAFLPTDCAFRFTQSAVVPPVCAVSAVCRQSNLLRLPDSMSTANIVPSLETQYAVLSLELRHTAVTAILLQQTNAATFNTCMKLSSRKLEHNQPTE